MTTAQAQHSEEGTVASSLITRGESKREDTDESIMFKEKIIEEMF